MPTLKASTEIVALKDLTPHPENVRTHKTKAIVKESLKAHGQYKPIVAQRSTGYVISGNGLLVEMRKLRYKKAEVRYVDVSDEQAVQILLVDNKSSDGSGYDEEGLATLLTKLSESSDALLVGTGYSDLEVANLLAAVDRPDAAPS